MALTGALTAARGCQLKLPQESTHTHTQIQTHTLECVTLWLRCPPHIIYALLKTFSIMKQLFSASGQADDASPLAGSGSLTR